MLRYSLIQLGPVLAAVFIAASHTRAAEPVNIGSRLELFVDHLLIEDMRGEPCANSGNGVSVEWR